MPNVHVTRTVVTGAQGWGKGGQKVNKTTNAVILTHEPTGTQVKVHATRSLKQNRAIARKQLALRVDEMENGDDSVVAQKRAKLVRRNKKRAHRASKKYGSGGGGGGAGGDSDGEGGAAAATKVKLSAKQKQALRKQKKGGKKGK